MRTAYLLYRKTHEIDAYPFAIDFDLDYVNEMARFKGVNYVELPLEEVYYLYDNKLDVLQYMKGKEE
jgi:hypothetical protein